MRDTCGGTACSPSRVGVVLLLLIHVLLPQPPPSTPPVSFAASTPIISLTHFSNGVPAHLNVTFFLSCYLEAPSNVLQLIFSLRSYRGMNLYWEHVHLYIEFAPGNEDYTPMVSEAIEEVFAGFPTTIHYGARPQFQHEWLPHIARVSRNGTSNNLVLFLQVHDHPWVDSSPVTLHEGLRLAHADPHPLRTIYLSHWPEALRLAVKVGNLELFEPQGYVAFTSCLVDSLQVFSAPLLWWVFVDTSWGGMPYGRIDSLVGDARVWGSAKPRHITHDPQPQRLYVPLREQLRHMSGYTTRGIPEALFPTLDMSAPPGTYAPLPNATVEHLVHRMLPPHSSAWTEGSGQFVFPTAVIQAMLAAHGVGEKEREGAAPGEGDWP